VAVDVVTGRMLWQMPEGRTQTFTGGGSFIYRDNQSALFKFIDVRTGECIATAPDHLQPSAKAPSFTPDRRHLLAAGTQWRNRPALPWELWLEKRWPALFADGREAVVVLESTTGTELIRLIGPGRNAYHLSDDASTLVTVDALEDAENQVAIRVWDVSATRAYLWAIGAAAGTAIVLLGLRRAWRKLTGGKASIQQAPPPSAAA